MTYHTSTLCRLVPIAMLALMLAACASSSTRDQTDRNDAVRNGVIIDDLRAPSRQNY